MGFISSRPGGIPIQGRFLKSIVNRVPAWPWRVQLFLLSGMSWCSECDQEGKSTSHNSMPKNQVFVQSCDQLCRVVWFIQKEGVVIGSGSYRRGFCIVSAADQNRHGMVDLAQFAVRLDPPHLRHDQVEHDQIDLAAMLLVQLKRFMSVSGGY